MIANIEMLYQIATGINEPAPELVEGLKLVTEFVQDERSYTRGLQGFRT